MYLSGKILELTVGLVIILIFADPWYLLPDAYSPLKRWGRSLMITASGVLLFGTLYAKKQHRANILLFWLGALVAFITTIIYEIRKGEEYLLIFLLVVMGLLIYRVYNAEIETPTNSLENETKAEKTDDKKKVPEPSAPEDTNPPPYEVKGQTVQIV
ncbi:uncharacterized protein LOC108029972 [Drosophila biarmipes]|uniref:uncharacterized protein LOC108029972 n=1 Tax=Drosophila biarmipes TaxID=125945 RepID=UPI0007E6156F|nr:uncharacterized protein LOC108029972 [Drosophila biarmipes]